MLEEITTVATITFNSHFSSVIMQVEELYCGGIARDIDDEIKDYAKVFALKLRADRKLAEDIVNRVYKIRTIKYIELYPENNTIRTGSDI